MLRKLARIAMIASLAVFGYAILPHVREAASVLGFRHNPAQVLLYRLSDLDRSDYETEIETALAADDAELARSLSELADDRGIVLDDSLLKRIGDAEQFSLARSARQLLTGAVTGKADSPTAFAGALASDLTVIGDIRDLTQEAIAYPDHDNLTVALAATGVALTAALAVSGGTSAAGKVGVSAIKTAKKMGRLSRGLEKQLVRLTGNAVDTGVLKTVRRDLTGWNIAAAVNGTRRLIKPRVIDEITQTGDAVRRVFAKQGYRGTLQVLETADDTVDVRRMRRASDQLGTKFRGALVLKRGSKLTLHVAEIVFTFLGWIAAAAGWLLWAGYYSAKLTWKAGALTAKSVHAAIRAGSVVIGRVSRPSDTRSSVAAIP